jgi:hypothetical protein
LLAGTSGVERNREDAMFTLPQQDAPHRCATCRKVARRESAPGAGEQTDSLYRE